MHAWLGEHGLAATNLTAAGDWLHVRLDVSQANALLAADYAVFTHAGSGAQTVRTLAYSLPAALQGHVDLVHPTTV